MCRFWYKIRGPNVWVLVLENSPESPPPVNNLHSSNRLGKPRSGFHRCGGLRHLGLTEPLEAIPGPGKRR